MRTFLLLMLLVTPAYGVESLSLAEQHRLGSYLSYLVSTAKSGPKEEVYTIGQTCPACGGRGSVGDGVIESPCDFKTPDGLLMCGGTGKLKATGDEANDELLEDDYEEMFERLESSGGFTEEQEEPDIVCLGGNAWTFEDKRIRQATNADMIEHLVTVHGIERASASKMDREELVALHNLLHNSEVRSSAPSSSSSCPSGSCPSGSCPSGSCPTSSKSSGSTTRRGLFGRRR